MPLLLSSADIGQVEGQASCWGSGRNGERHNTNFTIATEALKVLHQIGMTLQPE
jgi:hypothetical protein